MRLIGIWLQAMNVKRVCHQSTRWVIENSANLKPGGWMSPSPSCACTNKVCDHCDHSQRLLLGLQSSFTLHALQCSLGNHWPWPF